MNNAESALPNATAQIVQQVHPPRQLVPAEQPQPQERRLQEERAQPLHRQRGAEDVADQPRVRPPVHPELELLHQPGHHADRDVDHQQRAEEPGQPQVLILPGAIPGRLQQRGQERQPDRDRDEEEMIDRRERELNPRQIDRSSATSGEKARARSLIAMVVAREGPRIAPMWVLPALGRAGRVLPQKGGCLAPRQAAMVGA